MLPSNQGDIKNVALKPGRHQTCNPLDSFDLRCESDTAFDTLDQGIYIKNVALKPGRHQTCNPLDSFDLRCESDTTPDTSDQGI